MKNICVFILLIFPAVLSNAQIQKDSLDLSVNNYNSKLLFSGFKKEINTYNFSGNLSYFYSDENFFSGIKENYRSTIIRSSIKNIKDEHSLNFISEYKFIPDIRTGLLINNSIFSDDREIDINKSEKTSAVIYSMFYLPIEIGITPFAGYVTNNQTGIRDEGFVYGAEGSMRRFELGEFFISSEFKFKNEETDPRLNRNRFWNAEILNEIENELQNNFSVSFNEKRNDFYFPADSLTSLQYDIINNIESRIETEYTIYDRLRLIIPDSDFNFNLSGGANWRDIIRNTRYIAEDNINITDLDTKIEEIRYNLEASLIYRTERFTASFKSVITQREELHSPIKREGIADFFFEEKLEQERSKNNRSTQITLSFNGNYNITRSDNISLSLLQRKLIYNTPSELNFDDRDELNSILNIRYTKKLNPFFDLFINFDGSVYRVVYIFAEKSSNNNTRRVIKLASGGDYRGKSFKSFLSAEVSASYTVYEFEDINPNFRSFSFRQLTLKDSTEFLLTKRIGFNINGYLKVTEQGDFNWSDFTSSPERYLREYSFDPKLFFRKYRFQFSFGMRYFSLSTFSFKTNTEKELISNYTSIGPFTGLTYNSGRNINIFFEGWYEFINNRDNNKSEMPNLELNIRWML